MADNNEQQQQGVPGTDNSYTGGLNKDSIDLYNKGNNWTHARNATTNLPDGQLGAISTEPATILCCTFPYPLIGRIPLYDDVWAVFLTDDSTWEIGYFYDNECRYSTITGPQACPIFNRLHLVIGAARRGFDCGHDIYWSTQGYSYDCFLNTAKVPFIQIDLTPTGPCRTYVDTTVIDCEKLRLAPHMTIPCLKLAKSEGSGQLENGTYQCVVAYCINGIRCTDYLAQSPLQSPWSHNNTAGAIKLTISGAETNIFNEMEVVIISRVNSQIQARRLGIYSTFQTTIYIDDLDLTLINVPLEQIPLITPAIEKSDAIYSVSNYLTRVGPYTDATPNYQPLANNIRVWWTCVEYPEKYYWSGGDTQGMNVGYMRDETYALYIRWVRRNGSKTLSYSIPGLPAGTLPTFAFGGPSTGDSGTTVAHGRMAGYSSTELYPDTQPNVWGPLCGLPIMHHKFPDQTLHPDLTHFTQGGFTTPVGTATIRVMGLYVDNIALPVDINGSVLQDIQGYEILRASREGHMGVIAKGQVNHMRGYTDETGKVLGLYQNYPYDDLHPDRYLTTSQTIGTVGGTVDDYGSNLQSYVSPNVVTFHSPDTVFEHPNLGGSGSLVLYQSMAGTAIGSFNIPYQHPKFKMLTDQASRVSFMISAMAVFSQFLNTLSGAGTNLQIAATSEIPMSNPFGMSAIADGSLGSAGDIIYFGSLVTTAIFSALIAPFQERVLQEQILNVIQGLVPAIQTARQYDSHGFYDTPVYSQGTQFTVNDYSYISGHLQTFSDLPVNNLFRNNYVALKIEGSLPAYPGHTVDPVSGSGSYGAAVEFRSSTGTHTGTLVPGSVDCSRFTLGQAPPSPYAPGPRPSLGPFASPIISWYGAYKVPQPSQYGQIDSGKEIPISCMHPVDVTSTGLYTSSVLFGGDTYINRYTEKNPMMFFNDWIYNKVAVDEPFDYTQYENLPYPRYWVNNSKIYYDFWQRASKNWHLDELDQGTVIWGVGLSLYVKGGFMYLFNNGVRDFFVESTVNVGYRDWEDDPSKRFYDPYRYTSLDYLFRSDIIKSDILYKYDYSLSANRFWNQYISWGQMFDREYDPVLAYTCYAYYPRRINYSLPQDEEDRRDNWRMFLANNYRDMPGQVSCIEEISNSGALILMKDRAPVSFLGVQTIPSGSGTDYTVGNGLLFNQNLTSVSNADQAYQYGSCQNRLSVLNTPHGVFWVSRDSGKIFIYAGDGMKDITPGLKWHMARYLPSQLLQQFPLYPYGDSPLLGIGVQCVYDNVNEFLYICKKDYKAKAGMDVRMTETGAFLYNTPWLTSIGIELTDTNYFEDCSWTASYDCKKREWVCEGHDWHPALNIPSKRHFLTSNTQTNSGASVWRHNMTTGLFCSYYGVQAAFEIEYTITTGMVETTLQSVQYMLDSYAYKPNQIDKFSRYFNAFDYMVVWNEEQSSGILSLVDKPYDNPYATLNYPDYSSAVSLGVLQDKVENKFRVSMGVSDLTNDRHQFTLGTSVYWDTAENGYTRTQNPGYINYNKPWNQIKKIRGRNCRILLRRNIVGNNSMSLYIAQSKNILSKR